MKYGEPVGAGRYGILDTVGGDPVCHECGQPFQQLATHARLAHGIATAAEYRRRYGLGATTRLVGERASAKLAETWHKHEGAHLARLAEHRDPHAAYAASRASRGKGGAVWAPEVRALRQATARATRSRDLTPEETAELGDGIDLQAWADAARRLRARGVTIAALARAADITPSTVAQRMRRYPPTSGEQPGRG